jgi:flagellar biosynthetic protein FlhB
MSDRTEAPTAKRIEEAREEGRIARSTELNSAVVLLGSAFLLGSAGSGLAQAFMTLMKDLLREAPHANLTTAWLQTWGLRIGLNIAPGMAELILGILALGVVVNSAQTGMLWSTKKLGPDFSRVNPLSGIKRMFSSHGLIELVRALLKLLVIGWVTYSYLMGAIPELRTLGLNGLTTGAGQLAKLSIELALRVGQVYLVLGVIDYAYQRWDWMRGLKMSKQDIKEEYKRSEGDPMLKSFIRSQQRRMARGRMMSNVPKASVVVVNPTHLAVAIEYQPGMHAPKVLAKGAHRLAERIVATAREHNIPVIQNIPLARAIYKTVEVDREIPPELYMAMAELLARVFRMRETHATT